MGLVRRILKKCDENCVPFSDGEQEDSEEEDKDSEEG